MATTKVGSALESDLQDTADRGKKWLVNFDAEKTQLVSFDCVITLVLLMREWMGLFLKLTDVKMWKLSFGFSL